MRHLLVDVWQRMDVIRERVLATLVPRRGGGGRGVRKRAGAPAVPDRWIRTRQMSGQGHAAGHRRQGNMRVRQGNARQTPHPQRCT